MQVTQYHPLNGGSQATLFSFALSAEGARTVSGSVLFRTSAGWFVARFASIALTARAYRYASDSATFTRTAYESDPIYAQFPQSVKIDKAFVANASASGDQIFGWDARGDAPCGGIESAGVDGPWVTNKIHPLDPRVDLDALPPSGEAIANAALTSVPGGSCTQPVGEAVVDKPVAPYFPDEDRDV